MPAQVLITLIIGGLMGLLGQGTRAIIGLKGVADSTHSPHPNQNDVFVAARLYFSLMVGFLVGVAAALIYLSQSPSEMSITDWHVLLGFAASGYLGTDFLEGFVSNFLRSGEKVDAQFRGNAQPASSTDVPQKVIALNLPELLTETGLLITRLRKKPTYEQLTKTILDYIHKSYDFATVNTLLGDPKDKDGTPQSGLGFEGGTDQFYWYCREIVDAIEDAYSIRPDVAKKTLVALPPSKTVKDLVNTFWEGLKRVG
jgi:hypothetical protein